MATREILGETFTLTSGENGTQYVYEGGYSLSLVVFYSSPTDYAVIVWDNESSTIQDYDTHTMDDRYSASLSLYTVIENGFDILGCTEAEYRDDVMDSEGMYGHEEYGDDDVYDYAESYMTGDSDLMNEW